MFPKLFAESGLSLDRLRAFLAVAAAGSIVKAAAGDPVRQSQYSRQIKELEDFFRIKLVERQGKGIRLTMNGKELARISRFFLLGLSNFQRGCQTEEQTFRIGTSATFARCQLIPALSNPKVLRSDTCYIVEIVSDDEIERRLHDLTLDFGVTSQAAISRPLQLKEVGTWRLKLLVPRSMHKTGTSAVAAFGEKQLPLVLARKELEMCGIDFLSDLKPRLVCDSFLEALVAMETRQLASVLPDFVIGNANSKEFVQAEIPGIDSLVFHFRIAWNPRLLRLNPQAIRRRDFLCDALAKEMRR